MRRLAYLVVIVAGGIFVLDWLAVNYSSFTAAYEGTRAIPDAIAKYRGVTHFPECAGRWRDNDIMREGCDANDQEGYANLAAAWKDPALSTTTRAQIATCWQQDQTAWGPDWMLLGGCASLFDPRAVTK